MAQPKLLDNDDIDALAGECIRSLQEQGVNQALISHVMAKFHWAIATAYEAGRIEGERGDAPQEKGA